MEVILLSLDHFRGHIVQGTAESSSKPRIRRVHTPAEICDFEGVKAPQDVLRFEIPVDYVFALEISERLQNLLDAAASFSLIKYPIFLVCKYRQD